MFIFLKMLLFYHGQKGLYNIYETINSTVNSDKKWKEEQKTVKMRIKRIVAGCLSVAVTLSLLLGGTDAFKVNAAEHEAENYSNAGTMNIVSRRVTKPELYGNVPEAQKSVSDENPVAVVNEALNVNISGSDIIDYIRFAGASEAPAQRKGDAGEENIRFSSLQSSLAAVSDWTNLPVSIEGGDSTTTATNFPGEGTTLTFTVPTVAGEARVLTIYAGGHPNTGTITASATMGEETIAVVAGSMTAASYAFTPNSSQVTEYALNYTGTGQDMVVTLSLSGTGNVPWAGISVAAAVLRDTGSDVPEAAEAEMTVVEKVVSKSSLYSNVPQIQKTVSEDNPVAVENKNISLDFTTADVIDYLRFTGTETPERKSNVTGEMLAFTSSQKGFSAISDWSNLEITCEDGRLTTAATNFQGEGATVNFTVPTVAGEERILDIYAGGHPNTGTYTAVAALGEDTVPVTAGGAVSESYVYTPGSSQIVHYQVNYTGTGQELTVSISLAGTGGVNWAGIGVAAVVLKQDISIISPQKGSFNKSTSDVEYRDLETRLSPVENANFEALLLGGEVLSTEHYTYDNGTSVLTLKASYLKTLATGNHEFIVRLSDGDTLSYTVDISDAGDVPRPYVKDTGSLSNSNLNDWTLWYRDEFEDDLNDWWEPSYLKWWSYSS